MEFVNPTGLLGEVMRTEFIPLREKTLSLMRELLGPDASEEEVVFLRKLYNQYVRASDAAAKDKPENRKTRAAPSSIQP